MSIDHAHEWFSGLEKHLSPQQRQIARRILREIRRNRRFVPATVRENLNWREVARLEVNAPDLPGVYIDVGQSR